MGKGVKIKAPKITVGKDLGTKNLGKAASGLVKNAGKVGSKLVKTVGKGAEGIVANTADIGGAIAKGDFKGIGKEGLELLQSGKDIVKGVGSAAVTANTGLLGAAGAATGSKDITRAAENIDREGQKGINKYGDAAIDMAANISSAGTYGLAKQAAQGLSSGGLGGMLSGKGLQDMALGAAASYYGIDPNIAKMGLSAAQGDLKGAALQGLANYGGLDPNMLKMGAAALTGDKAGLASGLASQFGAGDSVANMLGAAVSGNKNDMISALGGQLGLDPKMSNMLGAVASGDIKGAALQKLAGATGIDPKLLSNLSSGKIDPMQLAGAAGFDPKSMLGGAADKLGVSSLTRSPAGEAISKAPKDVQAVLNKASEAKKKIMESAGGKTARVPTVYDVLDENEQRILKDYETKTKGFDPDKVTNEAAMEEGPGFFDKIGAGLKEGFGKVGEFFSGEPSPSSGDSYQIQKGDTFNAIAKKLGITPEELRAANPNLTDINKIAAGAKLNLPKKEGFFDKVGSFAKNNPNLIQGAIQGAGALAGYNTIQGSAQRQQQILDQQETSAEELSRLGKYQFDPRRAQAYDQTYGFNQDVIASGGITDLERAQEEEDELKSARMRAAARLAGEQALASKGQGSTGTGSAYMSMLAGQQDEANVGTQARIARRKQAAENLRSAYEKLPQLMETKSKSEIDLENLKSYEDKNRVEALRQVREKQAEAERLRGDAMARLVGTATDTASKLFENYVKAPEKPTTQTQQPTTQTQQVKTQQQQNQNTARTNAAAQVAGNRPPAEMATGQPGSGAGVLAPQPEAATGQPGSGAGVLQPQFLPNADKMNQALSKVPAPLQQPIKTAAEAGKKMVDDFTGKYGFKF